MQHYIDPTIDCVFKAILSAPGNENLLVHFLNGIIKPVAPIVKVKVLNPYNEKKFLSDKLTIVDIKAADGNGVKYQIEVQLTVPQYLANRMLYTWSDIYQSQMVEGDDFSGLKATISIWLLTGKLFAHDSVCHHHFQTWDNVNQLRLTDHQSIHVLELAKWHKPQTLQGQDYWLYFFKEAKYWKELPQSLKPLAEMEQAMKVLETFSEREKAYHIYQSRQNYIRVQRSDEKILERTKAQVEAEKVKVKAVQAKVQAEQAKVESEKARADKAEFEQQQLKEQNAQLLEQLKKAGVKTNHG